MPLSIELEQPKSKTPVVEKIQKPSPETLVDSTPAKPEATPEELEEARKEFLDGMFSNEKPAKKIEKKPEPEKPDPDKEKTDAEIAKKEADEAAAAVEKAKKKKAKPSGLDPAIEEDRLEDITKRVADKLKSEQQSEPAQKEIPDDLNDEDKQVLEAVEKLQNSPKFKGRDLVAATKDFWKKEADYIAAWEAKPENAGEEFNVSDPVHAAFYKRNQPPYSDADLSNAQEAVRRDKLKREVLEEVKREIEPQQKAQAAQEAYRQHGPAINQSVLDGVSAMVASASPEFKKLMTGEDNKLSLTPEILAALEEVDPVALAHLDNEAHLLRVKISELEKLNRLGEYVNPDINLVIETPAGDVMPHRAIMKAGTALEEGILQLPRAEQIHEGKQFITRGELMARRNEIVQGRGTVEQKQVALQQLDRKYWYINSEDIKQKFIADSVNKMRPFIAATKKQAEKYKATLEKNGANGSSKNGEVKPANRVQASAPSVASSSDSVNTQVKPKDQAADNAEEFVKAFF